MIVLPFLNFIKSSHMARLECGSTPAVGSSKTTTFDPPKVEIIFCYLTEIPKISTTDKLYCVKDNNK